MQQLDRQSVVQSLVEGALRAAADTSVTAVLRSWDWYDEGTSAQPLMPFLVVAVTDDRPLGIGIPLYTATCQVTLVVDWAPGVRDQFDRIRASVRSVMASLPGLSAAGSTIDGCLESTCSEPSVLEPQGDVVLTQTVVFTLWFSAPLTPPAVVDPEIYLAAFDPATGFTYTTTQSSDPRRITRWGHTPAGVLELAQGFGAWADRASIAYTAPVTPVSTQIPPPAAADS
jgi:hypothetical protein